MLYEDWNINDQVPGDKAGLQAEAITILIVEDNRLDLKVLSTRLTNIYGSAATLVTASNYAEAATLLRQPFDVCLLDYNLDFMTAFQLLKRLAPEDLPGPVILITGENGVEIELEAADYGIADYLKKSEISDSLLRRTIHYSRARHSDLRRISYLARYDQLTKLLNRQAFIERFQALLSDSVSDHNRCYLIYFDVDNFKSINDSYGHDIGDRILIWLANRLRGSLRESDIVARLGGDEFVAIVSGASHSGIALIADKLLDAFREDCHVGEQQFRVSVSYGIVRFSQGGSVQNELMVMADQAMYRAKKIGRDNYTFFDASIAAGERYSAQAMQELRRAMDKSELFLVYEPLVCLNNGEIVGAEALVRWRHPEKGVVYPSDFLPVAESTGLILRLGRWVLSEALFAYLNWLDSGAYLAEDFKISVNVSPTQLLTSDFVDFVLSEFKRYKLPGSCLQVELTENVMLSESQFVKDELMRLSHCGVTIAVDDFGTGYSSFTRLAEMNFDALKLDLSHVSTILHDPTSLALVESFVFMAEKLKLTVIAEGVETKAQAQLLASIGCGIGQGWLFGGPDLGRDQFLQCLQKKNNKFPRMPQYA